jgi:putative ABC transport system permease protein
MKITAKLAYSQIRINRSRTVWTLSGIVLSTALIAAVWSFAASGGALMADLFGEENSNGAIAAALIIPAIALSALVGALSIVVISNAFRISAGERTEQFGILKSVGATKGQIASTVIFEGLFLSAVGIPLGIITGLLIAFVGINVANFFLGQLNRLVHMMMNEITIVIDFVVTWQTIAATSLISLCCVLFSAWSPARKAAKNAAIVSIRSAGVAKNETKRIHTSPLTKKLFGFEGTLAEKSIKRNKRNFRASVVSLTVSVILFITLSALSAQMDLISKLIFPDVDSTVIVEYTSLRESAVNSITGRDEVALVAPIENAVADGISDKLRKYENTTIFGVGVDMETCRAIVPKKEISPEMLEAFFAPEEMAVNEFEISAEILTLDPQHYLAFCEAADVSVGSNILINHYSYNNNGAMVDLKPFLLEEQKLRLIKADGSIIHMPIHGILTEDDISNELLPPNRQTVRLIVPKWTMRSYSWYADPNNIDGFIDYANAVMDEAFPQADGADYMELGYSTRVYTIQDYMKVMNIGIGLATVFVYSFVALLTLIGLTNIISTASANVRMRAREFAVLQSVGMTYGGLKRMLNLESVMFTVKALIIGLPVAIVLTYLINLPIRSMFPVPYQLPWLAVAESVSGIFAITWGAMHYSAFRLRKGNIVETIRLGSN